MESTPEDSRSRQFKPSSVTRARSYEDEVLLVNYPDQTGPLPQEFYYRATAEASLSVSTLYPVSFSVSRAAARSPDMKVPSHSAPK
jgi:hypothetical protein